MNQTQALNILKTGANVFLTGEPGSGKTYTINQYVEYLHSHGIEPAITASTGIAATHIGGMTIHSWSGIGIKNSLNKAELHAISTNNYVVKRVGPAKVLIIDEISMLNPHTLEMIDAICRQVKKNNQSFGGMQVVLVGDFFQLPPVNKRVVNDFSQDEMFREKPVRFAYETPIWAEAEFVTCYLTEQYRQDDKELVELLGKIRSNSFDSISLSLIQNRQLTQSQIPSFAPKLFSHNVDVDTVNDKMLAQIPKEVQFYPMSSRGHEALVAVMKKGCLSPESLYLKVGASVMFTKNNQKEGYVNGTLGLVEAFDELSELPIVKLRNGRKVTVSPAEWTVEEDGKVKGRLVQIPLRLAWAITVHKSQGISLDEAVIDLSRVFEFGQGYVAISRVKRLSGIYILGYNEKAFQVDPEVLLQDNQFRSDSADTTRIFLNFPPEKFKKLQEDFIVVCGGTLNEVKGKIKGKKDKISTYDETLALWQEGKNIAQIAKTRAISEKTVFDHIETLVGDKKIKKNDLVRIVSADLLRHIPIIQDVFKKLKTDKLTPVFERFGGRYSYDDLKIARLMMK